MSRALGSTQRALTTFLLSVAVVLFGLSLANPLVDSAHAATTYQTQLEDGLRFIESIPDAVLAQGDAAVKEYVARAAPTALN